MSIFKKVIHNSTIPHKRKCNKKKVAKKNYLKENLLLLREKK